MNNNKGATAKASPSPTSASAKGKPVYIPVSARVRSFVSLLAELAIGIDRAVSTTDRLPQGESMTQFNQRTAQWLKKQVPQFSLYAVSCCTSGHSVHTRIVMQAAEHGPNASFLSKHKAGACARQSVSRLSFIRFATLRIAADTGTSSTVRVGNIDSGEFANVAQESSSDAGIAYGSNAVDSGTFENEPAAHTYEVRREPVLLLCLCIRSQPHARAPIIVLASVVRRVCCGRAPTREQQQAVPDGYEHQPQGYDEADAYANDQGQSTF